MRSSTGCREIGDVGAGGFVYDGGATVDLGGKCGDKGRCSIDGREEFLVFVRRGEHKWLRRNGGQAEKLSGGILRPIHDWNQYKVWSE